MTAGTVRSCRRPPLLRLVIDLARPYRWWLAIVLASMLLEAAAGLATPWPLKVIIDSAGDNNAPPRWLPPLFAAPAAGPRALTALAALAVVLIAGLGAAASYIDNYYSESISQWVAHDLRMRVYDHLEHLSFSYYDAHQAGALLGVVMITHRLHTVRAADRIVVLDRGVVAEQARTTSCWHSIAFMPKSSARTVRALHPRQVP